MHFLRAMPLLQKLSDNLLIIVAKRCLGMGLSDKLGGQCTFAAKEVRSRNSQYHAPRQAKSWHSAGFGRNRADWEQFHPQPFTLNLVRRLP
jgi:hypothetical protein